MVGSDTPMLDPGFLTIRLIFPFIAEAVLYPWHPHVGGRTAMPAQPMSDETVDAGVQYLPVDVDLH